MAKLADAQLAKYMHHDYMAAKGNVGPFVWTAPEIMWGEGGTPASDMWRCASTLHICMCAVSWTPDITHACNACNNSAQCPAASA